MQIKVRGMVEFRNSGLSIDWKHLNQPNVDFIFSDTSNLNSCHIIVVRGLSSTKNMLPSNQDS